MAFSKVARRIKIRRRIRKDIKGTSQRPRLSIYRSNKAIYGQLIDDLTGQTLLAVSTSTEGVSGEGSKVEQAKSVGKVIAEKASGLNIDAVVFDRGGYLYHGRVKALAEGAREGGLKF